MLSLPSLIVCKQLHIYNSINTKGNKYNGLETMVNPRPRYSVTKVTNTVDEETIGSPIKDKGGPVIGGGYTSRPTT